MKRYDPFSALGVSTPVLPASDNHQSLGNHPNSFFVEEQAEPVQIGIQTEHATNQRLHHQLDELMATLGEEDAPSNLGYRR